MRKTPTAYCLIAISCVSLFLGCRSSVPDQTKNYIRENRIKEYQVFEFEYKFGQVDTSTKKLIEHFYFDSLGRNTKRIFYRQSYDMDNGFYPDTQTVVLDFSDYEKSRSVKIFSGDTRNAFRFTDKGVYDLKDRETEMVTYDSSGNIIEKTITTWNGEESIRVRYDKYGEQISRYIESPSLEKLSTKDGDIDYEINLVSSSGDTKYYRQKDSTGIHKYVIKKNDSLYDWRHFDPSGNEKYATVQKIKNGLTMESVSYTQKEPKRLMRYVYTTF